MGLALLYGWALYPDDTARVSNVEQGVWKGVRTWTRRVLEKAGEKIMDVDLDGDDPDEILSHSPGEGVDDNSRAL